MKVSKLVLTTSVLPGNQRLSIIFDVGEVLSQPKGKVPTAPGPGSWGEG